LPEQVSESPRASCIRNVTIIICTPGSNASLHHFVLHNSGRAVRPHGTGDSSTNRSLYCRAIEALAGTLNVVELMSRSSIGNYYLA